MKVARFIGNTFLVLIYASAFIFIFIFAKSLIDNKSVDETVHEYKTKMSFFDGYEEFEREETDSEKIAPNEMSNEEEITVIEPVTHESALKKTVNTIGDFFKSSKKEEPKEQTPPTTKRIQIITPDGQTNESITTTKKVKTTTQPTTTRNDNSTNSTTKKVEPTTTKKVEITSQPTTKKVTTQKATTTTKKPTTTTKKITTTTKKITTTTKKVTTTTKKVTTTTKKATTTTKSSSSNTNYNCSFARFKKNINSNGVDRIHYISVGHADSILIESNGHYGLIDAGLPGTSNHIINYLRNVMNCSGKSCDGKLDFIVGTHSHDDHIGAMTYIANEFANKNTVYFYRKYLYTTNEMFKPQWDNYGYYTRTINAMKKKNVCLEEITNKMPDFTFGDFNIKLLNTEPFTFNEAKCLKVTKTTENGYVKFEGSVINASSKEICTSNGGKLYADAENKNSIIELITYKNSKTLLASDMEVPDEKRLISNSSTKNLLSNVNVLKFGHHASKNTTHVEFLKVLKPKVGIVSSDDIDPANVILLPMKYMKENYNAKIYVTGYVNDAIVQTFSSDGKYSFSNSDNKTSIGKALLDMNPVTVSGNWYKYNFTNNNSDYRWYYFSNKEKIEKTKWLEYKNNWYYLNNNGSTLSNEWKEVNGKWYYFNADGLMKKGWIKYNNNWYYLGKDGVMVLGWQKINWHDKDSWFYFDSKGKLVTNQCRTIDAYSFCFDSNGVCYSGKGC